MWKVWTILPCVALLMGCSVSGPVVMLNFPGPHEVKQYLAVFEQPLEVTVFYPDAVPPSSGFPLVIYETGWNQPRASFDSQAAQIAQWGYVAIIHYYPNLGTSGIGWELFEPRVAQASRLIDWCAVEDGKPGSPLYGMVDAENVGITGHSFGGSVAVATATLDPRIKACIPLDATYEETIRQRFEDPAVSSAAFLYITSGSGGYCSHIPFMTESLVPRTNPPVAQLTIIGADHMDYIDARVHLRLPSKLATPGDIAKSLTSWVPSFSPCPSGEASAYDVRCLASRYSIAWLNLYLKGMTEFEAYFDGEVALQDTADGLVQINYDPGP